MRGSIGKANFYKDANGDFKVRRRREKNKSRLLTDPAYGRTREHMAEFGSVMKAGKLIRNALAQITHLVSDRTARNRLTSLLIEVAKSDPVNPRGFRNIMAGNAALLKGFEFSTAGVITSTFKGSFQGTIDRDAGKALVSIAPFTPGISVVRPAQATHFQLHAAVLEINFDTGFRWYDNKSTPKLVLDEQPLQAISLETTFAPLSDNLVLLLFGIDFHLQTNGIFYTINSKDSNGLQITEVSQV